MLLVENTVLYRFLFFCKLLLDFVYLKIQIWNQLFMAIPCSFLCGVYVGEYIVFAAIKRLYKKNIPAEIDHVFD